MREFAGIVKFSSVGVWGGVNNGDAVDWGSCLIDGYSLE